MKILKIGADPFPPYQFLDGLGNICGSDYEFVKSVVNRMGYESEFFIDEWHLIEELFDEKKLDIVFQVQKTEEREKKWIFSSKMRDAVTCIITSHFILEHDAFDSVFKNPKHRIAVIKNYQYGEPVDSIPEEKKVFLSTTRDIIQEVNQGYLDFGVVDLGVFEYESKYVSINNIQILHKMNFERPLYVAFHDYRIRDEFNYSMCE